MARVDVGKWGNSASTSEGIQLDETAVGAMGIEWTRGVTLYGAEEESGVAGERGVRKSAGFGTSKAKGLA